MKVVGESEKVNELFKKIEYYIEDAQKKKEHVVIYMADEFKYHPKIQDIVKAKLEIYGYIVTLRHIYGTFVSEFYIKWK